MVPARAVSRDVAQADLSSLAEIGARRAGGGIERDEARIERRFVQSSAARPRRAVRRVDPRREPAVDQPVAVFAVQVDQRIEDPSFRAGLRIERNDSVERRGQVQRAVDDERRRFEAASTPAS